MLTGALIAAGGLVALVAVLTLVGYLFIPRGHTAGRTMTVRQSREDVLAAIRDLTNSTKWWPIVRTVERVPDPDGAELWRLIYHDRNRMTLRVDSTEAPARLVWSIADVNKMFEGTWAFDLATDADGCRLTLTEHGVIANPFFRCLARMMMDPTKYIDIYLRSLAAHLGERHAFA
jgi:uncharacterized protein YndB with AHSA1/START domain